MKKQEINFGHIGSANCSCEHCKSIRNDIFCTCSNCRRVRNIRFQESIALHDSIHEEMKRMKLI